MSVDPDMHVYDTGTAFEMVVRNRKTNKPLPLMGLIDAIFLFEPPTMPAFIRNAELVSPPDGMDGRLFYTWEFGDVEETGKWRCQALVQDTYGMWHTDIEEFTVGENIEIPEASGS